MSIAKIHAVYSSESAAKPLFEELATLGVDAKSVVIIGEDCDAFREATASFFTRKVDKLLLYMGAIGAVVGGAAAFFGMPDVTGSKEYVMTTAIVATACGAGLGAYAGSWMAGIIHLDNFPTSTVSFRFGTVVDGKIAVSIQAKDQLEAERIKRALRRTAPQRLFLTA